MNKTFLLPVAGMLLCSVYGCKSAAEPDPANLQIQQTLKEINQKLDSIDGRLKKLENKKPVSTSGMAFRVNNNGPGLEVLSKITLPENPTREQAREYVRKIVNTTIGQNSWGSDDPQVTMLTRIGNKNLDLLLEQKQNYYVDCAINKMVTVNDKARVINAFSNNRHLIGIICMMGWTPDAKEILVRELKTRPNNLPTEWIDAIASLRDPKTYPDLIDYFINGTNQFYTYKSIKNLPGIEMESAVAKMWSWKKVGQFPGEADGAAVIAVEWGHRDALELLIKRLNTLRFNNYMFKEIREAIVMTTGQYGSGEELEKWFKENGDKLVFDKNTRKYVVTKTENKK